MFLPYSNSIMEDISLNFCEVVFAAIFPVWVNLVEMHTKDEWACLKEKNANRLCLTHTHTSLEEF